MDTYSNTPDMFLHERILAELILVPLSIPNLYSTLEVNGTVGYFRYPGLKQHFHEYPWLYFFTKGFSGISFSTSITTTIPDLSGILFTFTTSRIKYLSLLR